MKIYKLAENDISKAINTPEDGMGYQIARLGNATSSPNTGILINGAYFAPIEDAPRINSQGDFSPKNRNLSESLFLKPPTDVTDLTRTEGFLRRTLLIEASGTMGAHLFGTTTSVPFPPHVGATISPRFGCLRKSNRIAKAFRYRAALANTGEI